MFETFAVGNSLLLNTVQCHCSDCFSLGVQGHCLSSHLTDEQRAEMKAYMSLVESVFVNAVVCCSASSG